MSAGSTIVKLEAKDEVTPVLKSLISELEKLDKKVKDLKADKKKILNNDIESDIASIKKLQKELKELQNTKHLAESKTKASEAIKRKQRELEAELTKEINRQTIAYKNKQKAMQIEIEKIKNERIATDKLVQSKIREKTATDKTTNAKKKENAVRKSTINGVVRHLRQIETLVVAYYTMSRVINATVTKGILLNKTIEDGTVGIAALIAANTEGGNSAERFSSALAISAETILAIKKASIDTSATFPQLTEVFQQAIGGALGASKAMGSTVQEIIDHTIKLSQRMTNIAGAIGMPMEQVAQEIRAVMEGTITKDARIAKMLGITTKDINDAKKNAGGLFEYLEEQLSVFDVLEKHVTFTKLVARFTEAIDTVRLEANKPIFEGLKLSIDDATKYINEHSDEIITKYREMFKEIIEDVGFTIDVFSGIGIVFRGIELGFHYLVKTILEVDNLSRKFFNGYIEFRNKIADLTGSEKWEPYALADIGYVDNQISGTKKQIDDLVDSISNGRDLAKKFIENIDKAMSSNKVKKQLAVELVIKTTKALSEMDNLRREAQKVLSETPLIDNLNEKYKPIFEKINSQLKDSNKKIRENAELTAIAVKKAYNKELSEINGDEKLSFIDEQVKLTKALAEVEKMSLAIKKELAEASKKEQQEMERLEEAYQNSFKIQEDLFILQLKGNEQSSSSQVENEIAKIQEALDLIADPADEINEKFLSIFDTIDGIFNDDQMEKFFKKWNKSLEDINKESSKYEGIGSKDWTAGLSGQVKDIANIGNAFADLGKEQEQWAKYSKENSVNEEDTNKHLENQIGLYGNIAGAVVSMANEGSAAAQVAQVAQTALAVAQGVTAILTQGSGDPYTAIPRMIAMAAMVASTLSSIGGSAGGGGMSNADISKQNISNIEDNYAPIMDKFNRQIELLEAIDKNGSAAAIGVDNLKITFERDYQIATQEALSKITTQAKLKHAGTWSFEDEQARALAFNQSVGANVFNGLESGSSSVNFDRNIADNGLNFLKLLDKIATTGNFSWIFNQGWGDSGLGPGAYGQQQSKLKINDMQEIIQSYTMGIIESLDALKDAGEDFKESYDDITQSMYYENKRLAEAFKDVDSLRGDKSFSAYLQDEIENIEKLSEFFTQENLDVLISQDPGSFTEQIKLLEELQNQTGITFEGGAREALDYLESIELVTQAMATSNENIKSWENSFKTDLELTKDLAKELGIDSLATSFDGLSSMFDNLKSDIFGLTDLELDFLNANKALLDEQLDTSTAIRDEQIALQRAALSNSLQSQNDSITNYNAINKTLLSLQGFVTSYRASNNVDYSKQLFDSALSGMSSAVAGNNTSRVSELSSDIQNYGRTYIGSIASNASSATEAEFLTNSALNAIDKVAPERADKTLVDINARLESFDTSTQASLLSFEEANKDALAELQKEEIQWNNTINDTLIVKENGVKSEIAELKNEIVSLKNTLALTLTQIAQTNEEIADNTTASRVEAA